MIVQTVGKFFKTSTVIVCHCRTCPRRMCTRSTYYYYYYYYYCPFLDPKSFTNNILTYYLK